METVISKWDKCIIGITLFMFIFKYGELSLLFVKFLNIF